MYDNSMMTSSNGNIFRVTGPLCGEFTGLRWIPRTKASDAELWYFLWSASEQTIEQTTNREAGDLRRHRGHSDVTVIIFSCTSGGDCECLCTAIANYAAACSRIGIHVEWRSQDVCRKSDSLWMTFCRDKNFVLDKTDDRFVLDVQW